MSDNNKFPIDPSCLAKVRDEALAAAKKSSNNHYFILAAAADEVLNSYGTSTEIRSLQKKKQKLIVS